MPCTSCGLSRTICATCEIHGRNCSTTALIPGSKALPTSRATPATLLRSSCRLLAVVAAREAYSCSIEPANCCASLTLFRLPRSSSRLVSSGVMAPMDSVPNSSASTAGRFAAST
ncbi:hypothetical protein D3C79_953580 [compost metagenome]